MALKCTGRGKKSPLNRGVDLTDTDPPKKSSISGQSIHESGHSEYNVENGPRKGDLIRGEHLSYLKNGMVEDIDYNVEFEKDTSDVNGAYKIWKTTGLK